jgi:nitrogen fixation NifU-like protein
MIIDQEKLVQVYKEALKQIYSEVVLDHGQNPRNHGNIAKNNAFGIIFGPCGDTMSIWLYIENKVIIDAGFTTDGCMTSLAAGSMVTELAKGKNINDALQISQQDVLEALDGLPKDSEHCALLAANTLKEAVKNYSK